MIYVRPIEEVIPSNTSGVSFPESRNMMSMKQNKICKSGEFKSPLARSEDQLC